MRNVCQVPRRAHFEMFIHFKLDLGHKPLILSFVVDVVVQFYPWFNFFFILFLGILMYDNELETRENKIKTKDKIEPQHGRGSWCG